MSTNPQNSAEANSANNSTNPENLEWQLAEIVDAIAAEIDHAEDTLSLKSYARGMSFAIKQLSLDLEVTVRRDADGRILFRTVDQNQSSSTVLKLDFAQVLQNQLQGVRKPLDRPVNSRPVQTLSEDIKPDDIKALNAIAIYSVDDLERYTQTAAMLAEVSRKTGIADPRIRKWRQLPYFSEVRPTSGSPGSIVTIEGGNFGTYKKDTQILFQSQPVTIEENGWNDSRLRVKMPTNIKGSGNLFAVIDGEMTNNLSWEATTVDLFVRDIIINPAEPTSDDVIQVKAELINQGGDASQPFEVEWTVDGNSSYKPHGPLPPNQPSQESCLRLELKNLSPGKHTIRFTADPERKLSDIDPANSTFTKEFIVGTKKQLTIGDTGMLSSVNPLLTTDLGPGNVLSLIFRGLVRCDSQTGQLMPDMAKSWTIETLEFGDPREDRIDRVDPLEKISQLRRPIPIEDDMPPPWRRSWQQIVTFELREDVRFHNGIQLSADDVAYSYQQAKNSKSSSVPWSNLLQKVIAFDVNGQTRIAFYLQQRTWFEQVPAQVWTLGIVPRRIYETDPNSFSTKPIGSGPFQVKSFIPNKEIQLSAFRDYVLGTPRLDQIVISSVSSTNELRNIMLSQQPYSAAVMSYLKEDYDQLSSSGKWKLTTLPASSPQQLHIQTKQLFERTPNVYDINWNAHLWYLA